MKAVQIGILVALLVVGGLLYKVYRGQQSAQMAPPVPATQAENAQAQLPPPPQVTPAPETPPAAVQPEASAPPPAPRQTQRMRPSPAPAASRGKQNLTSRASEAPPAPAPAQAPAAPTAPAPAPQAAADTTPPLNPLVKPELPPPPRQPRSVTIPAGTSVTVRLGETLSTDKNQPGDSFTATLDQPLIVNGLVIAERGAKVEGKIAESQKAGRVKGVSMIALQLTRLHTSDGQTVGIQTEQFTKEGPTSKAEDAKKVGLGAALGAAIGAIAGGGKGAAIGAGVGGAGGAGTVMATRGKPAEIPVETRLTFRLQDAVQLTEKLK